MPEADPFDCDRIQRETFVAQVHYQPQMSSTSDVALDLVAEGSSRQPLLVLAGQQTAGRGRGANRWWSAGGGLTFTLVLSGSQSGLPQECWPRFSLHVALAAGETLSAYAPGTPVGLKWPNDVFLGRRKACGILLEVPPAQPDCLVIGIGLNVNNSLEGGPTEIRETATSLVDETGLEHDRTDVLIRLLQELEREVNRVVAGEAALADRWRPLCLVRGRTITHRAATREVTGRCLGVAEDGSLLLETPAGVSPLYGGTLAAVEGLTLAR